MPKGPKGEKRSTDVIGNTVHVMRVTTSEVENRSEKVPGKDAAAAALGKRGGAARARNLTPEQRREIARKGAASRWKKPE
jgi:hypothetical protein